jgi:hypothetical protein
MVFGPGFHHERSVLTLFGLLRRERRVPIPARDIVYSVVDARYCAEAWAATFRWYYGLGSPVSSS